MYVTNIQLNQTCSFAEKDKKTLTNEWADINGSIHGERWS